MKKTTQKNFLAVLTLALMGLTASAQGFYTNGGLTTGTTTANGSTTSPAGYTWSELQSVGGSTNTNLGFGAIFNTAATTNLRIADNFTVTSTMNLTTVDLFCYQTGSTGTTPPIDQMRVQIWNGDPSSGTATVVAGNMTANIYNAAGSGEANMYRIGNNTPGTTRKIWRISGNLTATLAPGTYWVDFQVHATNDGSIFFPAVTIPGALTVAGSNAKQYSGTAWAGIVDAGSTQAMDMPFILNYQAFLGTESFITNNKMLLYPNPATNVLNLKVNYNATQAVPGRVEIYDLKGAKVLDQKLVLADADNYPVNVESLNRGVYLVKTFDVDNNEIVKTKLVKE
ncbi:T9SS type A sorting domain-containing protein [Flavobacterium sp. WV_118_3]|uniref:T9SS type A sorting domain-containing protein n=1 Tax=Flavobacterium sp. WV_118_3 TaxID=3151764 RepID=UPI002BCF67BE|nr:T9SS type A sorting domain-containing protein [Flavobacterium sp.]